MREVFFLFLTLGSFVAFLAYVRFCAWAGRQDPDAAGTERGQ